MGMFEMSAETAAEFGAKLRQDAEAKLSEPVSAVAAFRRGGASTRMAISKSGIGALAYGASSLFSKKQAGGLPDKVMLAVRSDVPLASLDAPVAADASFGEIVADSAAASPEAALMDQDARRRATRALAALSNREREVLELRFGLRNSHGRTLQEIADRFGVSRERVRQIEKRALERLRRAQERPDANGAAA